jgi:hypothetical protein
MKDYLISILDSLKTAIENDDIDYVIKFINQFHIDTRFNSPIEKFCRDFLTKKIISIVDKQCDKILMVERRDSYNNLKKDRYKIDNGVLKRNGVKTIWTDIGKLYATYKSIIK